MKTRKRLVIVAGLLSLAPAWAQVAPEVIPAGTRLRVKLETPISTKTVRVGDAIEGRLDKPVQVRGRVVLPKSVYVSGHVTEVRAANRKEKVFARLRLVFDRVSFPDGQTLVVQALPLGDDAVYDADSEGVLTRHGVTKGGAAADVAIGAAAGAGVGGIAGGGKGAEVGAGVGAAVGALDAWAEAASRWWNIQFIKGDKLWLRLDQDVAQIPSAEVPTTQPQPQREPASRAEAAPANAQPISSAASVAPVPQTKPLPESSVAAMPQPSPGETTPQQPQTRRVLLTDSKSWEMSGGFAWRSDAGARTEQGQVPAPKPEFVKALRERCPAVIVTTLRERADYIMLLDHSGWHSPPYRVVVLSQTGDVIHSGGTQLLGNAVKDACDAITAHR